jgi:hypothetical protein
VPRLLALACLLLSACGRFGFGSGDDAIDAAAEIHAIEIAPPAFSTSSADFVDVPGGALIVPPSAGTTWLLLTSAGLSATSFATLTVEARYLVDGVERGLGGTEVTGGFGPWQHFYVLPGASSAQTITYQLRDASGGGATIDQLHAVALPLPASADAHYAAVDDAQLITALAPAPAAALSLGALDGEYLVLLLVNGTEMPASSNIFLEWRGPGGEVVVPTSQFPREPWQSLFTARVVPLATSDAVYTLYAYAGSSGQVAYVRALALRADGFASLDHQLSTTTIDTQAPDASIATQLAPIGDAAQYVYLASTLAEESCTNTPDAVRRLHFMIDGDDRVLEHATDNCSYQLTYGATDLLQARPALIGTGVSSGNGQHVILRDSQILLLGLP